MKVSVVPPAFVAQRWHEIEKWLAPAFEFAQGDYEIEHVRVYVSNGQWMLLVAENEAGVQGAAVIEFINRPTKRVAYFVVAGGRLVSNPDVLSQMKAICKNFGATHFECAARESVSKLWGKLGFIEKYRIMGMKL